MDDADDLQGLSESTQRVLYFLGSFVVTVLVLLISLLVRAFTKRTTPDRSQVVPSRDHTAQSKPKRPKPAPVEKVAEAAPPPQAEAAPSKPGISLKQLLKDSKQQKNKNAVQDVVVQHPLFINSLKGHGYTVGGLAFSGDCTAAATACEDGSLRHFALEDVSAREIRNKRLELRTEPVDVAFGDKLNQVAVLTTGTLGLATVSMYELDPAAKGGAGQWEQLWETADVHGRNVPPMSLHSSTRAGQPGGGVLLSCSSKTEMKLLASGSGRLLAAMDSSGLQNHMCALSPDGRFVAAATFTADVKVLEVKFDRTGNFVGVSKVMDLKGHSGQVLCLAFSPDSTRMVTASKDGDWRVWNIAVRYAQQEDPKCLATFRQQVPSGKAYTQIGFGPGSVVTAAFDSTLHFLDAGSGSLLDLVEEAHGAGISYLQWAPAKLAAGGQRLSVLATAGRDKRVRLWKTPRSLV